MSRAVCKRSKKAKTHILGISSSPSTGIADRYPLWRWSNRWSLDANPAILATRDHHSFQSDLLLQMLMMMSMTLKMTYNDDLDDNDDYGDNAREADWRKK